MFDTLQQPGTIPSNVVNRLEIVGAAKTYGSTLAVREVTVSFDSSQVTAVVGGNGAGKSTLMKMIAGEVDPDSGQLLLNGQALVTGSYSPAKAHQAGIRIVHQELSLFGSLTVAENFYVEQGGGRSVGVRWRKNASSTADRALTEGFGSGHRISAGAKVDQLNAGQQQMVEISRAASAPGLRVLILDEPTSALGLEYIDLLARYVRDLQARGIVVLFITHKMSELPKLTDRIVVMREGALVADMLTKESTTEGLLSIMLGGVAGAAQTGPAAATAAAPSENATTATTATAKAKVLVSVTGARAQLASGIRVNAGEVVGLVGLQDAGQEDLLRSIQTRSDKSISRPVRSAYVTGDRKNEGIFPLWDSERNLVVSEVVGRGAWTPFRLSQLRAIAAPWFARLNLSNVAAKKNIADLSGGMQQKVLFARGLATDAELLLLNDPTRGVDLATKNDMYRLVRDAANDGKGVLWYSSEDSEMRHFDRVYVMHDSAVVAEFVGAETPSDVIMKSAFASQDTARIQLAQPTSVQKIGSFIAGLFRQPWIFALIGLAIVIGVIDSQQHILTYYFGLGLILTLAPVLAVAATAQMFILSVGDIDLGIGAFMGLIGVIAATSLATDPLLGIVLIIGAVALYPLLAWFLRVRQFPALVATLAMSFVYGGLALTILPNVGGQVPDWLAGINRIQTPFIPFPIVVLVVVGVLAWYIVERTALGTRIRALGSNSSALESSGWSVTIVKVSAYGLAGITAAIAGLLFAGIATSGDASAADGYTLMSIAAVVVGGCEFLGGKVSPLGVILAATLLSLMGVLLGVLSVPPLFTAASTGGLLLLVMGLRRLVKKTGRA
jgi:ribose transport system ATP-binding protein